MRDIYNIYRMWVGTWDLWEHTGTSGAAWKTWRDMHFTSGRCSKKATAQPRAAAVVSVPPMNKSTNAMCSRGGLKGSPRAPELRPSSTPKTVSTGGEGHTWQRDYTCWGGSPDPQLPPNMSVPSKSPSPPKPLVPPPTITSPQPHFPPQIPGSSPSPWVPPNLCFPQYIWVPPSPWAAPQTPGFHPEPGSFQAPRYFPNPWVSPDPLFPPDRS